MLVSQTLPANPTVAAPITTTLMFADSHMGAPVPILRVNDNMGPRRVVVSVMDVPADISAASNCR